MAKRPTKAKAPKGQVASASMAAGSSGAVGAGVSSNAIEQAMSQAVADALAEGITDPKKHRKLMLEARERVKAEAAKVANKASAQA